MTDFGTLP